MAYSKSKERMAYSLWQKQERGSHRLDALTIRYTPYALKTEKVSTPSGYAAWHRYPESATRMTIHAEVPRDD